MYSDRRRDISNFFSKDGIPVTLGILISAAAMFFLFLGLPNLELWNFLAFSTGNWPRYFWTPLTWVISGPNHPLDLVFAAGWIYMFGGSLERSWSSRVYALFLVSISVIMALSIWLASFVIGPGILSGLWVIAGPLAVAWTAINRRETLVFLFLPLPAPVLGVLGAAITWYYAGAAYGRPFIGLIALVGCAAAYWYAMFGRSSGASYARKKDGYAPPTHRRRRPEEDGSFNLGRYLRDRREKKRLEEIFRKSGFDDDKRR